MTLPSKNLPSRPLLSEGQIELLRMVADGLGHDQIGRRLGCSRGAVSTRLDRVYSRIGAINAPNAVAIAIRSGLLTTPVLVGRGRPVAAGGVR
jgi:DNA-binding CsgD family transcriptional regulator